MPRRLAAHRSNFGFERFLGDERGATVIEYALIASAISIVILGAATTIGSSLVGIFDEVAAGFN